MNLSKLICKAIYAWSEDRDGVWPQQVHQAIGYYIGGANSIYNLDIAEAMGELCSVSISNFGAGLV